jgi:uncharacterized protein
MATTYFAPAFRVKLNRAKLAPDVLANITSITVKNMLQQVDTFSLTLANPYPQLRWTHSADANLFAEGSEVEIEMGYVDNLHSMIVGEITSIKPNFPEGGSPTVQIDGRSYMYWLRRKLPSKGRSFKDMTDKAIVEQIAQEFHLTAEAEQGHTYQDISQGNQSALSFLLDLAKRAGFEIQVRGKFLYFRKPQVSQPATYTLVWGGSKVPLNLADRIAPLQNFTPICDMRNQVTAVVVRGYDPKKKQAIEARAGIGDEASLVGSGQTGGKLLQKSFGIENEEICAHTPVASQAEADRIARARYNERAQQLVTGQGTTVGLPDLWVGQLVKIVIVDPNNRFSGPYYISETAHTINSSGYRTNFSVQRNTN